ncbi:MAG: xanthine dehydrogenase family protein molybdopterin-binding subunit, partial [Proteobacteria bacterium]|nr:xanthine dehydrogenase family protein molybdopterin-binding subunit [Burkholderiales bacterium]
MSRTNETSPLPGSLSVNPMLDQWVRLAPTGSVTVSPGKVDIGQGISTALAQMAADELDVSLSRIVMKAADTRDGPNEEMTSSSLSIEHSGIAIRFACAEIRGLLLQKAASRLGVSAERLTIDDGVISGVGSAQTVTYWDLVEPGMFHQAATAQFRPKAPEEFKLIGTDVPRLDIPAKVTGVPSYVHDMALPGMLHARVVRPPSYDARLLSIDDEAAVAAMPGVVHIVRDGSFLAVVCTKEEQAIRAARALRNRAQWDDRTRLPAQHAVFEHLKGLPQQVHVVHEKHGDPAPAPTARTLSAHYTKPYIAHASIGPSCAVAVWNDGKPTIWSHTQGIFPLRVDLAKVLRLPEAEITVMHAEGAGCYGHNGADDAALDAALVARALPGTPVRLQWSREDEFQWEPFGPAMSVELTAALDAQGNIVDWTHELWSNTQSTRPGRQPEGTWLMAGWHLADPLPKPPPRMIPIAGGGGSDRNAIPLYSFANQKVIHHFITEMPVRVSALRSLGAFANVFAIESFIDELAEAAGEDPVAYRLSLLSDARARRVVETAAQMSGWFDAKPLPEGRGRGFGFARYKNIAAFVAVVAEVEVDEEVRLRRVWSAADAGLVISPDGARNQIEGGIIQGASFVMKERVRFEDGRVAAKTWEDYPILRFSEIPEID